MENVSQLLRAIQSGDRQAFESLFRAQGKRLHAIAYKVCGDRDLAEDVVQEAFLRILTLRAPFREEGKGEAWLARMIVRLALDMVRRRQARRRREEKHAMAIDPSDRLAEEILIGEEEAEVLSEGFQNLSIESRAALWLHLVEEESLREVAACLGTSRSTANRRIQSGLRDLKRFIGQRGLALHLAMPLGRLLRCLPVPSPSSGLAARICLLPASLPGSEGVSLPECLPGDLGTETRPMSAVGGRVGPARSHPLLVSAVLLALLGALGAWLWLGDPFGWSGPAGRPVEVASLRTPRVHPRLPPQVIQPAPEAAPEPPLAPFTVQGRVVDTEGLGVEGALVEAHENLAARDVLGRLDDWGFVDLAHEVLDGFPSLARATSDASGLFSLELPGAGEYLLRAHSAEAAPDSSGKVSLLAEAAGQEVEIVLERGVSFSGTVVDPSGTPIEGVKVSILPRPLFPPDRDFTSHDFSRLVEAFAPIRARTGAGGRFQLSGLVLRENEASQAIVCGEGYARFRLALERRGPIAEGGNLVILEPAVEVVGRTVLSPGDVPAGGVRIVALGPDEEGGSWFDTAISRADGTFAFRRGGGESCRLYAKLPGYTSPRSQEFRWGEGTAPLKIEFPTGVSIRGRVRMASSGEPVAGARVLCRGVAGALSIAETETGPDGSYLLRGMPREFNYDLFVILPGYLPREALREPSPEVQEVVHDIDLIPAAVVRGRVLGPRAEPVPNAMVEVIAAVETDRDGRSLRWRREVLGLKDLLTDEEGWFLSEDVVPSGSVYVFAYRSDLGEAFAGPVAFSGGEQKLGEIQVHLQAASLEVLALEAGRGPLVGVEYEIINSLIWDWITPGMYVEQWFSRRTSMDLSRYLRQMSLVPGQRECRQEGGAGCRWTDLMASPYIVSVARVFVEDPHPWVGEYWTYMGVLEAPLPPVSVSRLQITLDLHRTIQGRVVGPDGEGLHNLRVQAFFKADPIPGLVDVNGYSVTHSGDGGRFELVGVGPGPYRLIAHDRRDVISEVRNIPEGAVVEIVWPPQGVKGPAEKR